MSTTFFPYISFPGNGSEAMAYYHEISGGELNAMTYGDFPAGGCPGTRPTDLRLRQTQRR